MTARNAHHAQKRRQNPKIPSLQDCMSVFHMKIEPETGYALERLREENA